MGRFNLLDEPWISVITDKKGSSKEVSLKEFFENAHLYLDFAGDTKTQDFAVFRVMLAVLHTVFSRFDSDGKEYGYFKLDERFKQVEKIDEYDIDDYSDDLEKTWTNLWNNKKFPEIVLEYLEKWRDRFYLLDEEYPFFQVVASDVISDKINKEKPSEMAGKNINRKISESANKIALFSPRYADSNNKEKLEFSEIARWLITLHGYIGLSDKVVFGDGNYKSSKGWLFDIGGIYLKGDNLFETLMLNFVLINLENNNILNIQKPCWEYSSEEVLNTYLNNNMDNTASLYTSWSRAIYISPNSEDLDPFRCSVVKIPEIEHYNKFLEPMTIWKYNESGDNKDKYTPKKHIPNQSLWRSFGLITTFNGEDKKIRRPGVIDWFSRINSFEGCNIENKNIIISAVSMLDDANATSWVPTDEILDDLKINEFVLNDFNDEGWIVRVNEMVEFTKKAINSNYKRFLVDIREIRLGKRSEKDKKKLYEDKYVLQRVEDLYYKIDLPFREWLFSIKDSEEKDSKALEWKLILKEIILKQADEDISNPSFRDFLGIEDDGEIKNIATVYNKFKLFLNLVFKNGGSNGN